MGNSLPRGNSPQWASPLSRLYNHTKARRSLQDFSGRVISPTQRLVPENAKHSQERDIHTPTPHRRDSNPQSQQARSRSPARYTARTHGIGKRQEINSMTFKYCVCKNKFFVCYAVLIVTARHFLTCVGKIQGGAEAI